MAKTDKELPPSSGTAEPARKVGTLGSGKHSSAVGSLCRNLPGHVKHPPIEAVVFGWGVAEDGQLGVDTEDNVMLPKVVEALLGTRFCGRGFLRAPLVAGSRNSLALDADGQVLSWGWNARATLGLGHGQEIVRKPRRVLAPGGIRFAQVTIGGWHCLAVAENGQAYAWGGNEYGQCGLPLDQRDVRVPTPCVPHLDVTQVAAGGMHSCVLTKSGEIWTWGEPWGDFSMELDRMPRKMEGASQVAKIACGAFHNLALTWEGHVLAWGINDFGQLGNGSTDYEVQPTRVRGLEEVAVADISVGGWHSLAISGTGEVFVWGRGEYGRLGLGDTSGSSKLRATLVPGLEGHKVVSASCGGTHTLALTEEGRIFTWGRCSFGRLGVPVERDCYSPIEVYLPGGPERWRVISVCAGGRHNLALALPDNDTSSLPPRPMSRASSTQPPDLHHLPPGEPLDGAVDRNGDQEEDPTEANDDDLMADGEFGEDADESDEPEQQGGRSPPQDLVSVLDRQEAEEDEAAAVLNGGVVPGSAEEYALEEAGLSEENSPGGESPGLPTGRPTVDQQQLQSMLSIHGLRDVSSDD